MPSNASWHWSEAGQDLRRLGLDHGVGPAALAQVLRVTDHGQRQQFALVLCLSDLGEHLPGERIVRGLEVQVAQVMK